MALSFRWIEDAERWPRAKQMAMPWQAVCCADAAALAGWTWHRMARAIRRQNAAPPGSSMRGVRISPDQVAAISRAPPA
jgi:hypothetical protein